MSDKRPPPVSIRFSAEKLAEFDARRGRIPLGTYLKARLEGGEDNSLIAQIVALLGRIADLMRQQVKLLEVRDELDPELRTALLHTWEDIGGVKDMVMRALRIKRR